MNNELSVKPNSLSVDNSNTLNQLSERQLMKANQLKGSLKLSDPNSVLNFASGIQSEVGRKSQDRLSGMRLSQTGEIEETLVSLLELIKENELQEKSIERNPFMSFIDKLPFVKNIQKSYTQLQLKYEDVKTQLNHIEEKLIKDGQVIKNANLQLEEQLELNLKYAEEVEIYIAALILKVKDVNDTIAKYHEKDSLTMFEAQELNDLGAYRDRLEKRIFNLRTTQQLTLQNSIQIRFIQENNNSLIDKIQITINDTIPQWGKSIMLAGIIMDQKSSSDLNKAISETSNNILKKNAQMLKTTTTAIAEESERGIVDIETHQEVTAAMIETIETVRQIRADGRKKREVDTLTLENMTKNFKQEMIKLSQTEPGLIEINSDNSDFSDDLISQGLPSRRKSLTDGL